MSCGSSWLLAVFSWVLLLFVAILSLIRNISYSATNTERFPDEHLLVGSESMWKDRKQHLFSQY